MRIRDIDEGMGRAVFSRTVQRGEEKWYDVAERVAEGNTALVPQDSDAEFLNLRDHIASGNILMSGRHLQHGDADQPGKTQECFTNCSTAALSYIKLGLLLHGSGVGRCYDDDMMVVNWDNMPNIRCVLFDKHPDFIHGTTESVDSAQRKYRRALWHVVEDSREGWAKAFEYLETLTWEGKAKEATVVFDFSKVRPNGSPIAGMQNRPASGPLPLMRAFEQVYSIKGLRWPMWEQAKWVDHYLADCVLVGGVRRAARIATKWWKDPGIFDFINIKRPNKLVGLSVVSQIRDARKENPYMHGFLWTANNSITVDKEFWDLLAKRDPHAVKVFDAATLASYADGTGEPAFINVDKLHDNDEGLYEMLDTDWFGSSRYQPTYSTAMLADISERFRSKKYKYIVNPCAEIVLSLIGAYCVIADVVPFHAETLEEAEDAFRAATRALIRVNTMDSMYRREVERTNRIGVGITGLHEFAWKGFRLGFRDLLDLDKSAPFWETLQRFSQAVRDEATAYSNQLGVAVPHTFTTIKPAGTTSKLFGLTEGCHLPSMGCYMRWVQFKTGNELIAKYEKAGYPTRELQTYSGVTIVGFPTKPTICDVIPEENIVYAGDATPQEQYEFLRLLEKYWIGERGNQISYTLKYKPENTTYEAFKDCLLRNQPTIKCCSVMPQEETISYEYSPEEAITLEEYNEWMEIIKPIEEGEDVDREHLECDGGACPIEYREDSGTVSTAVSD